MVVDQYYASTDERFGFSKYPTVSCVGHFPTRKEAVREGERRFNSGQRFYVGKLIGCEDTSEVVEVFDHYFGKKKND